MMIELDIRVKEALTKINFIERYQRLSQTYNNVKTPLKERLRYIDGEIVLDGLAKLGYQAKFEKRENYFWIQEVQMGTYTFSCHIGLENGMVDMVWIVKQDGTLILGLPIGEYPRLMIDPSYKIKKPIFGTYEDLDEILKSIFALFQEFQKAMVDL